MRESGRNTKEKTRKRKSSAHSSGKVQTFAINQMQGRNGMNAEMTCCLGIMVQWACPMTVECFPGCFP